MRTPALRTPLAALLTACAAFACDSGPAGGASPSSGTPAGSGLRILNPQDPARDWFFDLGTVPYGEVARQVVLLENTDPRPVTVLDILPGCGCTVPAIRTTLPDGKVVEGSTRERGNVITLPPGAVAELELSVDTRKVPKTNSFKLVVIRIRSDSEQGPFQRVELRIVVDQPFRATPREVHLGQVPRGGGAAGSITIVPDRKGGQRLGGVVSAPDNVEVDVVAVDRFGQEIWELELRVHPPLDLGFLRGVVELEVLDAEGLPGERNYEVRFDGNVVPDLEVIPPRMVFVAGPPGAAPRAEGELVARLPGQRVRILETRIEGPTASELTVETRPLEDHPDGRSSRWSIALFGPSGLDRAELNGFLTLRLDDPQFPEVRVPFAAPLGP